MVSLSVSFGSPRRTTRQTDLAVRDSAFWYPDIPMPHLKFTDTPLNRVCSGIALPASLVLFGGSHGQDLPFVTGLTVWQPYEADDTKPLWAVEVSFSDARPPLYFGPAFQDAEYGGSARFRFPIDGPGGERITGFEQVNVEDWPFGFRASNSVVLHMTWALLICCSRSKQTATEQRGSHLQRRRLMELTRARTAGRLRNTIR